MTTKKDRDEAVIPQDRIDVLAICNEVFVTNDGRFATPLQDGPKIMAKIRARIRDGAAQQAQQARREAATLWEIIDWLIGKSGTYKSEYIQASIVMLREMFEEKKDILAAPTGSETSEREDIVNTRDKVIQIIKYVHDYDQLGPENEERFAEIERDLSGVLACVDRLAKRKE